MQCSRHNWRVVVVDDDPSVREALHALLTSVGLTVESFASAHESLDRINPQLIGCLVLDVRLPGQSGLDFHDELKRANIPVPVVFISGYADVRTSVRAMKAGAVDFLPKPFGEQEILDAIQAAVERHEKLQLAKKALATISARRSQLTARELDVMSLVVKGLRNKAIAESLGLSEVTVKAHRSRAMLKMGAQSLPDLVRMSDALEHDLKSTSR